MSKWITGLGWDDDDGNDYSGFLYFSFRFFFNVVDRRRRSWSEGRLSESVRAFFCFGTLLYTREQWSTQIVDHKVPTHFFVDCFIKFPSERKPKLLSSLSFCIECYVIIPIMYYVVRFLMVVIIVWSSTTLTLWGPHLLVVMYGT